MAQHHCYTRTVTVSVGGERKTVEVDVVIDQDQLAEHMAYHAMRNTKSQRSAMAYDAIKAVARHAPR